MLQYKYCKKSNIKLIVILILLIDNRLIKLNSYHWSYSISYSDIEFDIDLSFDISLWFYLCL